MVNRAVFYMSVNVPGEHYASIFRREQIETVVMYQITTQRDTLEDRRISRIFEKSIEQCYKEYRAQPNERNRVHVGHVVEQFHRCGRIKETTL
jgi:hypothetical protein